MKTRNILALLTALLLVACGSTREAPASAGDPLLPQKEQVWQLVRLQGRALPAGTSMVTLSVNPEAGIMGGRTACNPYSFGCTLTHGTCRTDGDWYDLRLSPIGSGSTRCTEADMNAESRYLATLGRATRLRLTATTLTLYQKNREILYFELQ